MIPNINVPDFLPSRDYTKAEKNLFKGTYTLIVRLGKYLQEDPQKRWEGLDEDSVSEMISNSMEIIEKKNLTEDFYTYLAMRICEDQENNTVTQIDPNSLEEYRDITTYTFTLVKDALDWEEYAKFLNAKANYLTWHFLNALGSNAMIGWLKD